MVMSPTKRNQVTTVARTIGVLGTILWALFITLMFRSYEPGLAIGLTLGVSGLFVAPLAVLCGWGLRGKQWVAMTIALVVVPVVITEVIAGVEEAAFVRQQASMRNSDEVVFTERWWPNQSSYLVYDPATGQLSGGD